MKPTSVMVWAGVGHNMKTPLVFIPKGVKINQLVYQEMLENDVLPWIAENQLRLVFQQDGAPSHTASSSSCCAS
jgi:hypothetical protein